MSMSTRRTWLGWTLGLGLGLLPLACASTQHREAQAPARIQDSAPEKVAAQRAAARGLDLEADDARWGVEAAQERKRADRKQPPAAQATQPTPKGPVDLKTGAAPASPPPSQ